MKRLPRSLTLAVLASLVLLATSAVIRAGHSWADYHWAVTPRPGWDPDGGGPQTPNPPFTLMLGDNLSSDWDAHLTQAIADWNTPPGSYIQVLELESVAGGTKPKPCKATDGRIEVCNAEYGFTGWLGVAQIWISGDHITQGVAKMNDTYFANFHPYNDPTEGPHWRQLVTCQEIAHGFGLHHQDENFENGNLGTCMDYTDHDPEDNIAPNDHDFQELALIHDHDDGFNSYDDGTVESGGGMGPGGGMGGGGMGGGMGGAPEIPPGLDQLDLSQPSQWGRMIASSADGRTAVFELDFGNGIRVRTFVIWA